MTEMNTNKVLMTLKLKKLKKSIKSLPKWYIFPFEINAGAVGNTETGYKPLKSKISDYGSYELIFTGDSPVIVIWRGSTKIYQKNKGETDTLTNSTTNQDQFYTKQYNIDTAQKWEVHLAEDTSSVNFGELGSNTLFNTLQVGRTYKLISFKEQIKVNDYLQFFVVLNDSDADLANDRPNIQDRQLLYLSNVTNKYNPLTNEFICQIITLSSVNDRLNANGKTVSSFIQYAGSGSGYAFPQFKNKKLQFNRELMRNIGVRYVHRQFYGLEALSSIAYFGRPIIQGETPTQVEEGKEIFEQKVYASRRLFIAGNNESSSTEVKNNGGLYAGLNDPVTTNSHPETTFYNLMDVKPTGFANYKDWQEFLATQQFNVLAEKSFKGVICFDSKNATESNGTSVQDAKFFWDSEWVVANICGNYNVEMSSNFRYKDPQNNIIIGTASVDYSKLQQKWMSSILNFNSVVFSSIIQMPYDFNQWLPFSFSTLPLIGKMLNNVGLGIPVGWVMTQNSQQYKKMKSFNAFMSAHYASALDKIFGKPGLIPLNAFSTQTNYEIGQMLGARVSTTALLMKLTDRISVYPWNAETGERLSEKEQISTVDLSQKRDGKVYIMDEETEFLDIKSLLTTEDKDLQWNPTANGVAEGQEYAYIIDYFYTQSLAQGEERHTFYSDNPYTYDGDFNEISVAQYKIKNQAAFTNNLFNWTTQYKLNHDEYSETEETTFNYPSAILPPSPLNVVKDIEIDVDFSVSSTMDNTVLSTEDKFHKFSDNIDQWIKNNPYKSKDLNINIKEHLDSSLSINSFKAFKRFYKAISIYYETDIESKSQSNNIDNTPHYQITENFNPSKKYNGMLSINLDGLKFNNDLKDPVKITRKWVDGKNDKTNPNALVYYHLENVGHKLISYNFKITRDTDSQASNIIDDHVFGLLFTNKENDTLNWNISVYALLAKIESIKYIFNVPPVTMFARLFLKNANIKIKKIVFTSK